MNPRRQPPALAVWLMERMGVAARNEPLAGDLLEEFRNGRSADWYWRQTFSAIVIGLIGRVRIFREDLQLLLIVWIAQASVLWTLWRYPVAPAHTNLLLAFAGLITVIVACYATHRNAARCSIATPTYGTPLEHRLLCYVMPEVVYVLLRVLPRLLHIKPVDDLWQEMRDGYLFAMVTFQVCQDLIGILRSPTDSSLRPRP